MTGPEIPLWEMVKPQAYTVLGAGGLIGVGLATSVGVWWALPLIVGGLALPLLAPATFLAWRARRAMLAFCRAVGGQPEVSISGYRRVEIDWPDRDLSLEAHATKGTTWSLRRELGDRGTRVQKHRIDAVVFETLGLLGELEADGEPWDGNVDGPLHPPTVFGVAIVGVSVAGLGMIALPERYALALGGVATLAAAVLTVWGGLRVRSELATRLTALERGGEVVGQPRFVHGGIQPRWALWVGSRFVCVEGLVLGPWSTLDLVGLDEGEPPAFEQELDQLPDRSELEPPWAPDG